jgi:RimJ/RimL family protein N-acetyltransferase
MTTVRCDRIDGEPDSRATVWRARDGAKVVGTVQAVTRPDQRTVVSFQDCRDDAYAPLLACLDAELARDLHTSVGESDHDGRRRLAALGFQVVRLEHVYRIDPGRMALSEIGPPAGISLVSAAQADLDRLRLLDDALRQDTPGSDGWRWSAEEFREEIFSDGFDPTTYQVAVEDATGDYVGIMRLWMREAGPRFGFVGVVPRFRRTRVTYALLATVFAEVRRRGHREVMADIDATNRASNGIAARAGAERVGGRLELHRPAEHHSHD